MKKHILKSCALALLALCTVFTTRATIYQIGTGTASSTTSGITPFTTLYEDNRIQYLYLASELAAAGATSGNIQSVAFNITSLGVPDPENVNISLGHSSATNITSLQGGLTVYYSAATLVLATGWNTFPLTGSGFLWNGTDNIIVEVCRDNDTWDDNYGVQVTNFPSGTSRTYGFYDDGVAGCGITGGSAATATNRRNRPNIQFDIVAASACTGTPAPGNTLASASTVSPGSAVSLSLQNATLGSGVTYQWYQNGMAVSGATGASYTANVAGLGATHIFYADVTCAGSTTSSAPVTVTTTSSYCVPTTTYGCADGDVIARVKLNTLDNNSGTGCPSDPDPTDVPSSFPGMQGGYSDYTSDPTLTTTLEPATTYVCQVWAGQYGEGYAAWIDYNDDGVFDVSERIGFSSGIVSGSGTAGVLGSSASFPITLSCTPPAGAHRMRVRAMYNVAGSLVTPCDNNSYGETEDYLVTITAAPACTPGGVLTAANITHNSVDLSWSLDCSSATNWDFEYGSPGFTPGTGTLVSNIAATVGYTLPGLTDTMAYDVYYRANCGSAVSAWSFPVSFTTMSAPCSGAPAAAMVSGAASICAGYPFILTATGLATGNGISHQWEQNIAGTWTPISGATSASLSVSSIAASTDYRLVSSCGPTASSSFSNTMTVLVDTSVLCGYCVATNAGSSQITNVTIMGTTLNNTTTGAPAPGYYNNFAATGSTTADLTPGDTLIISTTYDGNAIGSVWIDFDHDMLYEANEWVQLGTMGTSHTASIVVPMTAVTGVTGMRVRSRGEGNTNGSGDACLGMGSGETEDYLVTILPLAACSGAPVAGSINAPVVSSCPGIDIAMNITGQSVAGGITYEWQSSPAGGTNWQPIAGATNDNYTVVGGVSAVTDYRVLVTCTADGSSAMTVPITISSLPLTQCYCTPSYTNGCSADDDIHTFTMAGENSTGINDVNTGCSPNAYDDRTAQPAIDLGQGGTYSGEINSEYSGTEYVRIWVDFGDDGMFDSTDAVGTVSNVGNALAPFTVSIPATATPGMHRMRVRMVYNANPATGIDPCTGYTYGETHDYMANIVAACPPLSVVVSAPSTTVCDGASVTFTATAVNAGASPVYVWMLNGLPVAGATADTYTATALADGDVVTASVTGPCLGAGTVTGNDVTMTVTLPAVPSVTISASANMVCAGGTATFTAVGVNGGLSPMYQWYLNGSAITGANGAAYTATGINSGDEFFVEMMSSDACVTTSMAASNTELMSTYPAAATTITPDGPTTICTAGGSVTLTAGAGTAYLWSNGATTQSVTVDGMDAGSYYVGVTSSNGCVDHSDTVVVTAKVMPNTAKIKTVGATAVCAPDQVAFELDMNPGVTTGFSYQWSMDGSPIAGATDSTFSADATGDYTVTISGGGTCTRTSTAKTAVIKPIPVADFTTSGPTSFCDGGDVTLTAVGTGYNYTWLKDGNVNLGNNPVKTISASGEYWLIASLSGCKDTSDYSAVVTVHPNPEKPKIQTVGSTTVCEGTNVEMMLDNSVNANGASYQWSLDGTAITGATDATYEAGAAGNYTLTLTTANGCAKTSADKNVTVKPMPVANFTASGPTSFCLGGSVTLTAPSMSGYTYVWLRNGNEHAGYGESKIQTSSGEYTLVATLAGCKDTSDYSEIVTAHPLPVATISPAGSSSICVGSTATLEATPSVTDFTYIWRNNSVAFDTTVTTSDYQVSSAGQYTVIITDTNGCTGKPSSSKAIIKVNALPKATITAMGSTTIAANGSVKLKGSTGGGFTYQWYLDGLPIAGATDKTHLATAGGDYTLEVTKLGCTATSLPTTVLQSSVKEEAGATSNPIGTEDAAAVFELSAFPNPVSGILYVNVRGIEEVDAVLHVMDMNGRLISIKEMHEATAELDMSSYANGMYMVRYKDSAGRTGTIKINKQ